MIKREMTVKSSTTLEDIRGELPLAKKRGSRKRWNALDEALWLGAQSEVLEQLLTRIP